MAMYPIGQPEHDASYAQLKEDLANLSHTVEELIHATAHDSRGYIKELRGHAEKRLHEAREHIGVRGEELSHGIRDSVDHSNRYLHDNPWIGVGFGVALGVAAGALLSRR